MKLWEYVGKKVRLTLTDGRIIVGVVEDWDDGYTLDGDDEITIGHYAYPESDIKKIEVINNQLKHRKSGSYCPTGGKV